VNVTANFPVMSVSCHQSGFEPALEKRTDPPMLAIKPHAVRNVEPLNGLAEVGLRYLDQQMVMIRHQSVAVNQEPKPARQLRKQLQKMARISRRPKDRASLDPAVNHMIPPIFYSNA
jgi:hypothetical protein